MDKKIVVEHIERLHDQHLQAVQTFDYNVTVNDIQANRPSFVPIGVLNPQLNANISTAIISGCSGTSPTTFKTVKSTSYPLVRYQSFRTMSGPYRPVSQNPLPPNEDNSSAKTSTTSSSLLTNATSYQNQYASSSSLLTNATSYQSQHASSSCLLTNATFYQNQHASSSSVLTNATSYQNQHASSSSVLTNATSYQNQHASSSSLLPNATSYQNQHASSSSLLTNATSYQNQHAYCSQREPSTSSCGTPKTLLKCYSLPEGCDVGQGSSQSRSETSSAAGMVCESTQRPQKQRSIKIFRKNMTPLVAESTKPVPPSFSVENFMEQDLQEKSAEILDSLDEQSFQVVVNKVMALCNKMYGSYLAEELEKYLGVEKYQEILNSEPNKDNLGSVDNKQELAVDASKNASISGTAESEKKPVFVGVDPRPLLSPGDNAVNAPRSEGLEKSLETLKGTNKCQSNVSFQIDASTTCPENPEFLAVFGKQKMATPSEKSPQQMDTGDTLKNNELAGKQDTKKVTEQAEIAAADSFIAKKIKEFSSSDELFTFHGLKQNYGPPEKIFASPEDPAAFGPRMSFPDWYQSRKLWQGDGTTENEKRKMFLLEQRLSSGLSRPVSVTYSESLEVPKEILTQSGRITSTSPDFSLGPSRPTVSVKSSASPNVLEDLLPQSGSTVPTSPDFSFGSSRSTVSVKSSGSLKMLGETLTQSRSIAFTSSDLSLGSSLFTASVKSSGSLKVPKETPSGSNVSTSDIFLGSSRSTASVKSSESLKVPAKTITQSRSIASILSDISLGSSRFTAGVKSSGSLKVPKESLTQSSSIASTPSDISLGSSKSTVNVRSSGSPKLLKETLTRSKSTAPTSSNISLGSSKSTVNDRSSRSPKGPTETLNQSRSNASTSPEVSLRSSKYTASVNSSQSLKVSKEAQTQSSSIGSPSLDISLGSSGSTASIKSSGSLKVPKETLTQSRSIASVSSGISLGSSKPAVSVSSGSLQVVEETLTQSRSTASTSSNISLGTSRSTTSDKSSGSLKVPKDTLAQSRSIAPTSSHISLGSSRSTVSVSSGNLQVLEETFTRSRDTASKSSDISLGSSKSTANVRSSGSLKVPKETPTQSRSIASTSPNISLGSSGFTASVKPLENWKVLEKTLTRLLRVGDVQLSVVEKSKKKNEVNQTDVNLIKTSGISHVQKQNQNDGVVEEGSVSVETPPSKSETPPSKSETRPSKSETPPSKSEEVKPSSNYRTGKYQEHMRRNLLRNKVKKWSRKIYWRVHTVRRTLSHWLALVRRINLNRDDVSLDNRRLKRKIYNLKMIYHEVSRVHSGKKRRSRGGGKTCPCSMVKKEEVKKEEVKRESHQRTTLKEEGVAKVEIPDKTLIRPNKTYANVGKNILKAKSESSINKIPDIKTDDVFQNKSTSFCHEIRKSSLGRDPNYEGEESIVRCVIFKNIINTLVRNHEQEMMVSEVFGGPSHILGGPPDVDGRPPTPTVRVRRPSSVETVRGKPEAPSAPETRKLSDPGCGQKRRAPSVAGEAPAGKRPNLRKDAVGEPNPPSSNKGGSRASNVRRSYILRTRSTGNSI